jgi:predicted metal-dependent phosphoesterase TrpH
MTCKIDIHVHSRFSGDGTGEPEDYIEKAIELDLDGIVFTEHYSFEASESVEALKDKYRNEIMIFRGVELSSAEGHCLVFGVDTDKHRLSNALVSNIARVVNQNGGVVIPSHPFRRGHGMGDVVRNITGLCAIEGFNGYNMRTYNEKAVETAHELNVPYTGGSDAHMPSEVGYCYTEFHEEVTPENFIRLLKKGSYRGVDARRVSRGFMP